MTKNHLLNRWSELKIKDYVFKNRVIVPAMSSQLATEDGFVTDEMLEHYQRLSTSGASLLIVEYTNVHISGKCEPHQLCIDTDQCLDGLSKLAKVIKKNELIAGIQISHGGLKSDQQANSGEMHDPNTMNHNEIEIWKTSFKDAAKRAARSGFDLIEIHSAHGYGLNQWISPITNKRGDDFGKNNLGRIKLLIEIVLEIKSVASQLLLSVRMPGRDYVDGGLKREDSLFIAQALARAGVDIINISSGVGGWGRNREGEGYLVPEAEFIQKNISIPVIGVGGICTGVYIDQSLQDGKFKLAAVGRKILENPNDWKTKVMVDKN